MDEIGFISLTRDAIWVMIKVGGPILLLALGIGLVVSLFQALTQIQEMTLTFVPKMLAIFVALIVTMPFMVCLGLGGIRLWVKVTAVPRSVIAGLVGAMCLLGSYASVNDMFAMWTTIVFGILGYFLHKVKIHPAPIVLALILGGMTESNFRRSLMASGGEFATFVTHPVGVVCAILALLVFLMPFMRRKPQAPALAH